MSQELLLGVGWARGEVQRFAGPQVRVGRDSEAECQAVGPGSAEVSRRHARIVAEDGGWWVEDAGSRNGTWLNGRRLEGRGRLAPGDVIRLGASGPELVVKATRSAPADAQRTSEGGLPRGVLLGGLGAMALLLAVAAAAVFVPLERAGERSTTGGPPANTPTPAPGDGFPAPGAEAVGPTPGTRGVPAAPGGDSASPQTDPPQPPARAPDPDPLPTASADAEADPEVAEALRRELQEARAALRRLQLAGSVDVEAVQRGNRNAVALVFVEDANGEVSTGTAFGVRRDGLLATVRHLVHPDPSTPPPRRIAVQFSDSDQAWPATLVGVATDVDLAVIRIGNLAWEELPLIRGINLRPDTLGAGVPVVSLGFPLGGSPGEGVARPLVSTGVLGAIEPDRVQLFGYGNVGASGSPLLDTNGQLVGVLYGGRMEGEEQLLFGVSGVRLARFLGEIPAGREGG